MMFQDSEFRLAHIKEVQAKVLELPYAGEELSMLVLLPDDHVPRTPKQRHGMEDSIIKMATQFKVIY